MLLRHARRSRAPRDRPPAPHRRRGLPPRAARCAAGTCMPRAAANSRAINARVWLAAALSTDGRYLAPDTPGHPADLERRRPARRLRDPHGRRPAPLPRPAAGRVGRRRLGAVARPRRRGRHPRAGRPRRRERRSCRAPEPPLGARVVGARRRSRPTSGLIGRGGRRVRRGPRARPRRGRRPRGRGPRRRGVSSRAPGISSASATPCSIGKSGSAVPWTTSVGTAIVRRADGRTRVVALDRARGCARSLAGRPARCRARRARARPPRRTAGSAPASARALATGERRDGGRVVGVELGLRQEPPVLVGDAGRSPPDPTGEVLMRTSEATRSGCSSARTWMSAPPIDTPSTCAAPSPYASSTRAMSRTRSIAGVGRPPGLVGLRPAGVAMVVADDEPPARGEHPAEALVPPQHRRRTSP